MFKCILCLNDFDDSLKTEEHVFPESIGGTIKIWDLCKGCNDHLGEFVDSPLVNNWMIASQRLILKLPGKKGEIPNPLENGILSSDPSQKVKYYMKNGLPESVYLVPNVSRSVDESGNKIISIKLDKKDEHKLPQILDTIKKRAEKKGEKVNLDNIHKEEGREEKPWIQMRHKFDLYDWQRGIIKIAFELTYRKYGIDYLSEPIAQRIIELLRKKDITKDDLQNSMLRGKIGFAADTFAPPFLDDSNSLYGMLVVIDNKLICTVRIFNTLQGNIVMSENRSGSFPLDGDFIQIDVKNKIKTEMPYIKFIERFSDINGNGI